ncbi:MAG: hypothetical protein WC497_00365 [Patescibacteria group bacterium]
MTFDDVRIEYRPLRLGFCVRDGHKQDIATAVKLNTILWGGIYNPLIPVGSKEGLDHALVKLFQVDALIPISKTPEINKFLEKYSWARLPSSYNSELLLSEDSMNRKKKHVNVLDVSHILRKMWDTNFKFSKTDDSNCTLISWSNKDADKDLLPLLFGEYPKKQLAYKYHHNFQKALKAKEITLTGRRPVPKKLASTVTPLALTEQEIRSYGGNRHDAGVYIGDSKSFIDLLNFWNIRAAGSYITFLPKSNVRRFLPYIKEHLSRIKKPTTGYRHSFLIWYSGSKQNESEVKTIADLIAAKDKPFAYAQVSTISWNGLNIVPGYNILSSTTTIAGLNQRYGKPSLNIQLSDKPFAKHDNSRFLHQCFGVSVHPPMSTEDDGFTLSLPTLPDLNEWYARETIFDPHGLRVTRGALGTSVSLITDIDDDTIRIGLISKNDIITKVFERASIIASKSVPGLVAERVVSLMQGLMGSARIFKITGVRKFIEETHPLHQKLKYEVLKAIRDKNENEETFKKFENAFGLKGKTPITPSDVFDEMVEHNLLQVGVEVRCPKCGLKNWLNLKDVSDRYLCDYCSEISKFVEVIDPIKIDGKQVDGLRLHYRLSGLMGKSDKQQGAIPVILTLQFLTNKMHSGNDFLYSTGLDLSLTSNGKKEAFESDLTILNLSQRLGKDDNEVLIGECKTGHQITAKKIDNLLTTRGLLQNSGLTCHLVFSTTKKAFTSGEINRFKKLVKKGIKPILLTAHELEPWWDEYIDYKKTRQNFVLPHQYPFTFRELADNSVYVYELDK